MKKNLGVGFFAVVVIGLCLYVNAQDASKDHCATKRGPRSEAAAAPQAQMIEDFSYATGALTNLNAGANTSGGNWVSFSGTGNPILVSSGSLSYTGYPSSGVGNKIDITSTASSAEDAYRQFASQSIGTTTYAAFMVNVANTTGLAANSSTTGDYFAGFLPSNSTTLLNARVSIRQGVAANTFNLGLRATTNNTTATFGSADLAIGTTHLVVISYQVVSFDANDVVRMWINPVITGAEPAADITQITASTTDIDNISRFFVRQGTTTTPNASLDGVRIGASWADLLGGLPTPPKLFETWLKGSNEVPPNASTGRGYGRVVLNSTETQMTASVYWEGLGSNTTLGHIHGPAAVGANAGILFDMSPPTGATSDAAVDRVFSVTPQQVADLKAGLWYFNIHSVNFGGGEVRGQLGVARAPVDFNGDGKTDFSVVRTSGNQKIWYNLLNGPNTATGIAWGSSGDIETPEDFDGDNKTDIAVWRTGAQGQFFILNSSNGTVSVHNFGITGDNPRVVGDYDGDGKADLAIYRPSNSHWWYQRSIVGGNGCDLPGSCSDVQHGVAGDTPAPGDYDGDGKNDFMVRRGGFSARYWLLTATGVATYRIFSEGGQLIVPGDYDGDGKTDLAAIQNVGSVMRWWWAPQVNSNAPFLVDFGDATQDVVAHGDYDGDGTTQMAIWRNGVFWVRDSSFPSLSPINSSGVQWGAAGDFPVASFNSHN